MANEPRRVLVAFDGSPSAATAVHAAAALFRDARAWVATVLSGHHARRDGGSGARHDVAGGRDGGDGQEIDRLVSGREEHGDRVIVTGVAVEDDRDGHGARPYVHAPATVPLCGGYGNGRAARWRARPSRTSTSSAAAYFAGGARPCVPVA